MIDASRLDEIPTRDQALWPYVEKLRIWSSLSAENAVNGKETEFRVGANTLIVDSWEQDQMRAHFGEAGEPVEGVHRTEATARLTSLALALVTKVLGDIEELRIAVDHHDRVFRVQAELMLDVAMSRALIVEVQAEVEIAIREGHVATAKCLTDLRHKLQRAAEIARGRIAKAEAQLASFRSAKILEEGGQLNSVEEPESSVDEGASSPVADRLEELSPAETLREAHREERDARLKVRRAQLAKLQAALPTSTGTLTLAFFIALGAWIGMAYLPTLKQQTRPVPILGAQEFRPTVEELFAAWQARPPSLYLQAHDGRWSELSRVERSVTLDEIAGRASVLGYNGMVVTDSAGRPLAQWLRERGVLVYPDPPESPAADPAPQHP